MLSRYLEIGNYFLNILGKMQIVYVEGKYINLFITQQKTEL